MNTLKGILYTALVILMLGILQDIFAQSGGKGSGSDMHHFCEINILQPLKFGHIVRSNGKVSVKHDGTRFLDGIASFGGENYQPAKFEIIAKPGTHFRAELSVINKKVFNESSIGELDFEPGKLRIEGQNGDHIVKDGEYFIMPPGTPHEKGRHKVTAYLGGELTINSNSYVGLYNGHIELFLINE